MAKKQKTAVMLPIRRGSSGVTNPAAGVTPLDRQLLPWQLTVGLLAKPLPWSQVKVAAAAVLVATKSHCRGQSQRTPALKSQTNSKPRQK